MDMEVNVNFFFCICLCMSKHHNLRIINQFHTYLICGGKIIKIYSVFGIHRARVLENVEIIGNNPNPLSFT